MDTLTLQKCMEVRQDKKSLWPYCKNTTYLCMDRVKPFPKSYYILVSCPLFSSFYAVLIFLSVRYREGMRGRLKAVILALLQEYYRVEEAFQGERGIIYF